MGNACNVNLSSPAMMIIFRLAKVTMVTALAVYAFIVAYDNIVDYGSNYEFVKHVLRMDTIFDDKYVEVSRNL